MAYNRFVEVGRVCLINYGPEEGKLCTVIDVIDQTRVLVDGPTNITGVARQQMPIKRISLTDFKVKCGHNAKQKSLSKAWEAANVLEEWNKTGWAKKMAKKAKRAQTNDFERFKVMVARKKKSSIISKKVAELKKSK
jgi:large subunit ribosomal protein L14e